MELVVGTHNLMDGRRLAGLLEDHAAQSAATGLDVLCIQENRRPDGSACAPLIAERLGPSFKYVSDHPRTRLALVYDQKKVALLAHEIHALPRLTMLSRFERMFIGGATPQQKFVQIATFQSTADSRTGARFTVVNFHLDTAGGNSHRGNQIEALAALIDRGSRERLIACGDTNAFSIRRSSQLAALSEIVAPLSALSAVDPGREPTHFFARQREPRLTHRIAMALGTIGLDVPGRYDVVCSNLEDLGRGQRSTPDSDHDLVWARLGV